MSRSGPGGDTRAYIWPRSWRTLETLTAPIRPGCAFDPKAILGSHACDQSLKLYRDCWAATSGSRSGSTNVANSSSGALTLIRQGRTGWPVARSLVDT
jgi:hypothetical protein